MIFLLMSENEGICPFIQEEKYWRENGYAYTAYETIGAKTLSKKDIKIDVHCAYTKKS